MYICVISMFDLILFLLNISKWEIKVYLKFLLMIFFFVLLKRGKGWIVILKGFI